jgi:trypsin
MLRNRWVQLALVALAVGVLAAVIVQVWYGTDAKISSYPFMVSLENSSSEHKCGGVLLSDSLVLTAAHCGLPSGAKVRANSDTMKSQIHYGGVTRKVTLQCVHPDFYGTAGAPFRADLQLLRIESLGSHAPKKFATIASLTRSKVRVLGWGTTETGSYPTKLQKVTVSTVDDATCKRDHTQFANQIKTEHLCFGEAPKGSCHGDSGGPALNRWTSNQVVAIVSGTGAGGCNKPREWTVGAELRYYNRWIDDALAGKLACK